MSNGRKSDGGAGCGNIGLRGCGARPTHATHATHGGWSRLHLRQAKNTRTPMRKACRIAARLWPRSPSSGPAAPPGTCATRWRRSGMAAKRGKPAVPRPRQENGPGPALPRTRGSLVWCPRNSYTFAAMDFCLSRGASDEHTLHGSVRSEQRRLRQKNMPPGGLRRIWVLALLLVSRRSMGDMLLPRA